MKLTRKTLVLAAIAALLLVLNLLDRGSGERIAEQLPGIPAVLKDDASRIEISTATAKLVLEKIVEQGGGEEAAVWHVTAPFDADADQAAVSSLLGNYRKEIPMDARVDRGNLEDYGLDPSNGIVVEIWTFGDEPDVSVTVGKDAEGGASFVRLSGDDAIYRARVGGRHRYDPPPTDWRNRVLLGFDKNQVQALEVEQGGRTTLHVVRGPSAGEDAAGEPIPGEWAFEPPRPWPADQLALDALARSLGALRAGELLGRDFDGGFDAPRAVVEAVLSDGSERALEVGTRPVDGAAFVRLRGSPEVYRVAEDPISRALLAPEEYRDKTMFLFNRKELDTLSYEEGTTSVLLQQDLSNSFWNVIQPTNVDIDMKNIFFAVNTLAELRAHEVSEVDRAAAGLDPPAARIVLQFLDGHTESLELGAATQDSRGRPAWYVRVGGRPEVFLLREDTMALLKAGFGRS